MSLAAESHPRTLPREARALALTYAESPVCKPRNSGRLNRAFQRPHLVPNSGLSMRETLTARASPVAVAQECLTLEEYRQHMMLTTASLKQIVAEFEEQMKVGLRQESNLLMIPTLVDVIPDGHETGEFFGIEIGGSKLCIIYTKLASEPHGVVRTCIAQSLSSCIGVDSLQTEETRVPDDKRHCHVRELFDYIVQRVVDFASAIGRDLSLMDGIVVGLCFSFPMEHLSIKSGKLIKWTKGYSNEGAVGKDPVKLLVDAFKRQGLMANATALVNDTVGILSATRYTSGPDANVAVIMGTGTNACYVEQTRNISKWRMRYFPRTPDMVVNIEWPGFHSQVMPLLLEDVQLDEESHKPGDQAFEKLTAGLYMGDIARRILDRLAGLEGWFEDGRNLGDPSRFSTVELAAIAQDDAADLETTAHVLAAVLDSDAAGISLDVRRKAKQVCRLVTERSAQLTAAAVIGILAHIERSKLSSMGPAPRNIIAVEGGIFSEFRLYSDLVHGAVRRISGDEFAQSFELKLTAGSAAFGAAAVAAAGFRYNKVMGHVTDSRAPPRKFPPRRRSQNSLAPDT